METIDYRVTPDLYAKQYSQLQISGTRYLCYRDLPKILQKYAKGNTALDYGCGVGKSTRFFKTLNFNVDGVDINEDMIKIALDKDPSGSFKVIKSGKIPADDEYYDIAFAMFVLLEIPSKAEILNAVKDIVRVLKSNSIFLCAVRNIDFYNEDWLTESTMFDENKNLKSGSICRVLFKEENLSIFDYFYTDDDYREIFKSAGLTLLESHNPIGTDNDGYEWITEKQKSPCTIYVCKKM